MPVNHPVILSRSRFLEVKQALDEFNSDKISLEEFAGLITGKEAESYEYMMLQAGRKIERVQFGESMLSNSVSI